MLGLAARCGPRLHSIKTPRPLWLHGISSLRLNSTLPTPAAVDTEALAALHRLSRSAPLSTVLAAASSLSGGTEPSADRLLAAVVAVSRSARKAAASMDTPERQPRNKPDGGRRLSEEQLALGRVRLRLAADARWTALVDAAAQHAAHLAVAAQRTPAAATALVELTYRIIPFVANTPRSGVSAQLLDALATLAPAATTRGADATTAAAPAPAPAPAPALLHRVDALHVTRLLDAVAQYALQLRAHAGVLAAVGALAHAPLSPRHLPDAALLLLLKALRSCANHEAAQASTKGQAFVVPAASLAALQVQIAARLRKAAGLHPLTGEAAPATTDTSGSEKREAQEAQAGPRDVVACQLLHELALLGRHDVGWWRAVPDALLGNPTTATALLAPASPHSLATLTAALGRVMESLPADMPPEAAVPSAAAQGAIAAAAAALPATAWTPAAVCMLLEASARCKGSAHPALLAVGADAALTLLRTGSRAAAGRLFSPRGLVSLLESFGACGVTAPALAAAVCDHITLGLASSHAASHSTTAAAAAAGGAGTVGLLKVSARKEGLRDFDADLSARLLAAAARHGVLPPALVQAAVAQAARQLQQGSPGAAAAMCAARLLQLGGWREGGLAGLPTHHLTALVAALQPPAARSSSSARKHGSTALGWAYFALRTGAPAVPLPSWLEAEGGAAVRTLPLRDRLSYTQAQAMLPLLQEADAAAGTAAGVDAQRALAALRPEQRRQLDLVAAVQRLCRHSHSHSSRGSHSHNNKLAGASVPYWKDVSARLDPLSARHVDMHMQLASGCVVYFLLVRASDHLDPWLPDPWLPVPLPLPLQRGPGAATALPASVAALRQQAAASPPSTPLPPPPPLSSPFALHVSAVTAALSASGAAVAVVHVPYTLWRTHLGVAADGTKKVKNMEVVAKLAGILQDAVERLPI